MRCLDLLLGAALLAAAAPLHAADVTRDATPAWKYRFTYLTQLLSNDPDHVVKNHVVSLATDGATIVFEFTDGGALTLALEDGAVRLDGGTIGHYPSGGALESAWRRLAVEVSRAETPAALALVRAWNPEGLSNDEAANAGLFHDKLAPLSAPPGSATAPQLLPQAEPGGLSIDLSDLRDPNRLAPLLRASAGLHGPALRITVPDGSAHAGHFSLGSSERMQGHLLVVRGNADIYGTVIGNVATVEGNVVVHPGGVVTGDVLAVSGVVRDLGGDIRGTIRTLDAPRRTAERGTPQPIDAPVSAWTRFARNAAGTTGVFLTLLLVGFGTVLFARAPLEVVSDTVLHSFTRALLVGLLGQVLILPTFGMLVVGLVLSVAGILLVPFAVIVFALLLIVAVLGGFLAIAHAMGESLTRRQLARGISLASANSYRYIAVGLGAVALLWLSWVVFGWVPVAGTLIMATAILVTWLLATVGFGAALLSRAGFREHFAGRLLPTEALTDEYLWATPQFGVHAVKRPGRE